MNILPDFRTLRPASLSEAVTALAADGAMALGGGTDLLPNLRRGLGQPKTLVDLTAIGNLAGISLGADGTLRLGAGTSLEAIAEHPGILASFPAIAQGAALVAGPTLRYWPSLRRSALVATCCNLRPPGRREPRCWWTRVVCRRHSRRRRRGKPP